MSYYLDIKRLAELVRFHRRCEALVSAQRVQQGFRPSVCEADQNPFGVRVRPSDLHGGAVRSRPKRIRACIAL